MWRSACCGPKTSLFYKCLLIKPPLSVWSSLLLFFFFFGGEAGGVSPCPLADRFQIYPQNFQGYEPTVMCFTFVKDKQKRIKVYFSKISLNQAAPNWNWLSVPLTGAWVGFYTEDTEAKQGNLLTD